MKKINSIGYGAKIVAAGFIFFAIIPALLYLISLLWRSILLINLAKISILIGILIFSFLIILLTIELNQDKRINLFYQRKRASKMEIADGYYECQNCGNRKLRQRDQQCLICGVNFKE